VGRLIGCLACGLIITHLPFLFAALGVYSPTVGIVTRPGLAISGLIFPEGAQAGYPYLMVALSSNVALYAFLVWVILTLRAKTHAA